MQKAVERVAVIGAGIIGTAIAFELKRRGLDVVLIDKGEPGRGASYGNLASIAVTEFMPVSRPSVWRQIPKWLLDPQGPIRVRPAYLPKLTPWLLRFLEASRPSRVAELEAAGAALCSRVYEDLLPLLEAAGLSARNRGNPSPYSAIHSSRGGCARTKRSARSVMNRVPTSHAVAGNLPRSAVIRLVS